MCQLFLMRQDELKGLVKGAQTTEPSPSASSAAAISSLLAEAKAAGGKETRLFQLKFGYTGVFYFHFLVVFLFLKKCK